MSIALRRSINDIYRRWTNRSSRFFTGLYYFAVLALIIWGWTNRDQDLLTPENGLGYALGIVGCSLMTLLLTYSLRKRWRLLRRVLSVKFWFQLHMALGVLGPLAILFHGNFHLGSLNSTVALVCMLLVSGSGIIGKYLYTHIHYGLYGEKIRLKEVLKDFQVIEADLLKLAVSEKQQFVTKNLFSAIHDLIAQQRTEVGFFSTYRSRRSARKISVGLDSLITHLLRYHRKRARSKQQISEIQKKLQGNSAILLAALSKLPSMYLFERLFSYWHVIHIPIFMMMILTAIVHILVVHMY